jgi:hypothetical protein
MTSTAGPGISLMNEFIGLAYYAEVPVVIFDVTRVGPSTGLPTRTSSRISSPSFTARMAIQAHHVDTFQCFRMLRHGRGCVST